MFLFSNSFFLKNIKKKFKWGQSSSAITMIRTSSEVNPPLLFSAEVVAPKNNRLASLIDPSLYLRGANSFTGKLFFSLPLMSFENSDGTKTSINLTYNPLQPAQDQINLGCGWGLFKNMISFDPQKNQYSMTVQGAQFFLNQKPQDSTAKTISFAVVGSPIVIILDPTQAQFRVFKSANYSQTYQKMRDNCWLLSEEQFPDSSKLNYAYDSNDNLTQIAHSDQQQLLHLTYKTDGVFKLFSAEMHFLSSQQASIDFLEQGTTLSIMESGGNSFAKFNYGQSDASLVDSIALPALKIDYCYLSQDIKSAISADQSYCIQGDQPRIFYGVDYIVGAYIDGCGQLILEQCDSNTFAVKASGNTGYTNRYPPLTLGSDIQSYSILARKDEIVIFLSGASAGRIILFSTQLSDGFQIIAGNWTVPAIGMINSFDNGFYFLGSAGVQVFFKKNDVWQTNNLINDLFPAASVEGNGAWIYSSSSLFCVDDLTQPLKKSAVIADCKTDWLHGLQTFSSQLSSNAFVQQQINFLFSQSFLRKSGNFMVINSLVVPQDSLTGFRTQIQCFENMNGVFSTIKVIDDPHLLLNKSWVNISQQFFPQDVVVEGCTYRRQVFFSKSTKTILLRTRNITALPDGAYVNQNLDEIDWNSGISFSTKKSIQLTMVSQGMTNRTDIVNYKIQKRGEGEYSLQYTNPSLQADLNSGLYTFQIQTNDGKTVLLQPTKIQDNSIDINVTEDKNSQTLTATADNDYKNLYNFIFSLFNFTDNLSSTEFSNYIEQQEPIPDSLALAIAQNCLDWFVSVDDTGCVTNSGWELKTFQDVPLPNDSLEISKDYFLKEENGQVQLYGPENKKCFLFPVDSVKKIVNFYPSCLIYEQDLTIQMLLFHPTQDPEIFIPNDVSNSFKMGKLSAINSYPFNPFFTLAIEDFNSQTVSINKVPDLVVALVQKDTVISEQINTSIENEEHLQFCYQNPFAYQTSQMYYRSFTVISLVDASPQGKTVTTLTDNTIETVVYNQEKVIVKQSQSQQSTSDESDFSPSITLTSQLMSATGGFSIAVVEGAFFEEQEADFMSFESYEMGRIGVQKENAPIWQMNNASIMKGWSLSGEQFVTIQKGGALTATYSPSVLNSSSSELNPPSKMNTIFIVGVWIRSSVDLATSSPLTIAYSSGQSSISGQGVSKNKMGEWIYQEAILSLTDQNSVTSGTVKVTISSATDSVDVDSLIFLPLGTSLKARVFDPLTGNPTGVFDSKGSFQRLIYDNQQLIGIIQPNASLNSLFQKWNPQSTPAITQSLLRPGLRFDLTVQVGDGYLEDANALSIQSRWKIDTSRWLLNPFILTHSNDSADTLTFLNTTFISEQMGCYFECQDYVQNTLLTLNFGTFSTSLSPQQWAPNESSATFLTIRLGARLFLFVNNQLIIDEEQKGQTATPMFAITFAGKGSLKNLMIYSQPKVTAQYKNLAGKNLQSFIAVDENQVQFSLSKYDSLGRNLESSLQVILNADSKGSLLTYRDQLPIFPVQNFVYEASPLRNVNQIQYSQTEYDAFPSQIYRGTFTTLRGTLPDLMTLLSAWIPFTFQNDSYKYVVVKDPDGVFSVSIQNQDGQLVASYAQTKTCFIQNQFKYKDGQLTCHRLPREFVLQLGADNQKIDAKFERTLQYTSDGQLHITTDPDYGTDLMVHDPKSAALRFQIHYGIEGKFAYLLYFDYDTQGCVSFVGYHDHPAVQLKGVAVDLNDRDKLEQALIAMAPIDLKLDTSPESQSLQKMVDAIVEDLMTIQSSEVAQYSSLLEERGRLQTTYVEQFYNGNRTLTIVGETQEFFAHNLLGSVTKKSRTVHGFFDEVSYTYNNQNLLHTIFYPTSLNLTSYGIIYEYDSFKRVKRILTDDQNQIFAEFDYVGATSLIEAERFPTLNLIRSYQYNAANQLIGIKDPILEQAITYTSKAFQEKQTYKQLIASTSFSSPWIETVSGNAALIQLKEQLYAAFSTKKSDVDAFIQKLIDKGYLDSNGFLKNRLNVYFVFDLPTDLLDLGIVIPILERQPKHNLFGHQYAYEFSNQLTKAKYVTEESTYPQRFSISAIEQYLGLDTPTARKMYSYLSSRFYVTEDGIWNLTLQEGLTEALNLSQDTGAAYLKAHPIGVSNLLITHFIDNNPLNSASFAGYYFGWLNISMGDPSAAVRIQEAEAAWTWLSTNGFLDTKYCVTTKILSSKVSELIENMHLQQKIMHVVDMIRFYQSQAISQSANDVWLFDEDAHGNMAKYYVGMTRYQLGISSTSNRVQSILTNSINTLSQQKYLIQYDDNGNISSAPHLGIRSIHYDPCMNRPFWIEMQDGAVIQFSYDSNGMRSIKRVDDGKGNWFELRYLRNEFGQVLSEWRSNHLGESSETSYIQGPVGLVGFVRDGIVYTVLKDFEGSIRAILDDNKQVVFATHYLPYGQRTHIYGDPNILSYGYIGQELDTETGLYNFNARMYDPQLGRFYQVDPQRQYASPYLYSGNSPLSFTDPTGLFSWGGFFGGIVSGLEIVTGIAVDVLSAGALAEGVGGALIGAGVSGLSYSIESGDNFSWDKFGEEEGIGAAIGVATAGFGTVEGKIAETVVEDLAENSFKKFAVETATRMAVRAGTGAVVGIGQTMLENAANGRSWDDGLERGAWVGALTGAASAGIGSTGEELSKSSGLLGKESSSLVSKGLRSFISRSASGFAGDATGNVIVNAIQGQPLDSGLWQAAIGDAVGGFTGAGQRINPDRPPLISRALKFEEVSVKTNCLATAAFKSMEKQGLLGEAIKTPQDLRAIAADAMTSDLQTHPDIFRQKFKESIGKYIESGEVNGLTSQMQELVENVRSKIDGEGKSLDDVFKEFSDIEIDEEITNYIAAIKTGDVWGNFLELDYLSAKLKLKFRVDINGQKWSSIGKENASNSIFLRYSGDHYDVYYKQGVAFFTPNRKYVPIEEEHGFGAGKIARTAVENSQKSKELQKALKLVSPSDADALFKEWSKNVLKLKKPGMVDYISQAGKKLSRKAYGTMEFARDVKSDPDLFEAAKETVIGDLVNKGGSYADLANRCSFALLVESNHMPPFSVVNQTFGYDMNDISCVSMHQEDHRNFPSTGRFSDLSDEEIKAVDVAIQASGFKNPKKLIKSFEGYHDYLKSLYQSAHKQQSYANMLEIEIRVKNQLFDDFYNEGIIEAINYSKSKKFINAKQASELIGMLA